MTQPGIATELGSLTEREIVDLFEQALDEGRVCVHYQPQYNHSTGRLVGAEGLMRWEDPKLGWLYPADFVPILERNGLIRRADLHVFEQICRFLADCPPSLRVPLSFNVSRHDFIGCDYVEEIEAIREAYGVPVKYLRAEMTESSAVGGIDSIAAAIESFHDAGYLVEMDDFGSGYSSLSILKSLPVDILKLDLRFLADEGLGGRGGIILNSTVQMARWLETQTIAEGVETIEQADFLKSVGCNYVQGYLYSKPVPAREMRALLEEADSEETTPTLAFIRELKVKRFWDPNSLETFIFNSYIGAAAVFSHEGGNVEVMRVNEKFVKEFGMNLTETDVLAVDPLSSMSPDNREVFLRTIERAIESGEEESCETWRTIQSDCCGEERVCIRSSMRVIGNAGALTVIYAIIQNVTGEKRRYEELADSERRFRFASEQANMYAWEYTVDTKEMKPCFRCMRDLGLPPLVRNYPEPAIEAGIFPPDYADMYRDWHRQIAAGARELEAIIPLTVGRVPFHVRYTTEFDENGKPLKAYGSATLVIEEDEQPEGCAEEPERGVESPESEGEAAAAPEDPWSNAAVYSHIAHALARGYTDLYYVNIETDELIEFHTDDEHGVLNEARRSSDFFEGCKRDAKQFVHPDDQAAFVAAMDRRFLENALAGGKVFELVYRRIKGGAPFYVQMNVSRMEDDECFIVIAVKDIDEQVKHRREQERIREERIIYARLHALTGNFIVVYVVDPETGAYREFSATTDFVESFAQATEGTDFFGTVRNVARDFNHPDDLSHFLSVFTRDNVMAEVERSGIFTLSYRLIMEGAPIHVQIKAAMVEEREGPRLVVGINDVDAQVRQEEEHGRQLARAKSLATKDALTGVKNKHAYLTAETHIDHEIAKGTQQPFAIVMLDVNDLKVVNDTEGHQAGDQLLRDACKVICDAFKHSPVFRVGGDEFVVIAQGSDYERLEELVGKMSEHNEEAARTGGPVIACGMARFDGDICVATVFERADHRMYENKNDLKAARR